jgi:hypothetical protein
MKNSKLCNFLHPRVIFCPLGAKAFDIPFSNSLTLSFLSGVTPKLRDHIDNKHNYSSTYTVLIFGVKQRKMRRDWNKNCQCSLSLISSWKPLEFGTTVAKCLHVVMLSLQLSFCICYDYPVFRWECDNTVVFLGTFLNWHSYHSPTVCVLNGI